MRREAESVIGEVGDDGFADAARNLERLSIAYTGLAIGVRGNERVNRG
jgi:hypothetical protein